MFGNPTVRAPHLFPGRSILGPVPVALAVVLALLTSGTAGASSCGSHVKSKNERQRPATGCQPGKDCPPRPVAPCRGPECSRGNDQPLVPPSAPSPTTERDGVLAIVASSSPSESRRLRSNERSIHAIHH